MQIYGPAHLHGPQALGAPHHVRTANNAPPAAPARTGGDELHISDAARMVELAAEVPEIRHQRVDALRQAIASGAYETEHKLSVALDRLLDEIG